MTEINGEIIERFTNDKDAYESVQMRVAVDGAIPLVTGAEATENGVYALVRLDNE